MCSWPEIKRKKPLWLWKHEVHVGRLGRNKCIDTEELNAILPATASRYKGIVKHLCIYRRKERKTSFLNSLDWTHLCRMGMLVCGDLCYSLYKLYQSFCTIFLNHGGVAILVKKGYCLWQDGKFKIPTLYETPYGMSVSYSLLQKFKMVIEKRGLRSLFHKGKSRQKLPRFICWILKFLI